MGNMIIEIFPEIMRDRRLKTLEEKLLVCHVWGWQQKGSVCYTSNERLAFVLDCSLDQMQNMIKSLMTRKILVSSSYDCANRNLQVNVGEEEIIVDQDIFAGL